MMNEKSIQKKVAEVITQREVKVTVGGKTYRCAPATLGTLISVSDLIAQLPEPDQGSKETLRGFIFSKARYGKPLPVIYSMLILGIRKYNQRRFGFFGRRKGEILAKKIAENAMPSECREGVEKILYGIEAKDFFELTTFLKGVEITRPTKVGTEATASGQR